MWELQTKLKLTFSAEYTFFPALNLQGIGDKYTKVIEIVLIELPSELLMEPLAGPMRQLAET
jgi:hypothetical protein